jgi:hypothetical protein
MTATITDPTTGPGPAVLDPTAVGTATLSTGELETELLGLAGNLAAAQCRFLQLLAEFDRRGGWVGPGLKSCAHWLCWRIGMSLRTAAEHVRVAHALSRLPKITEAFGAGRISYSKVRAITRIAGQPTPDPPDDPAPSAGAAASGSAAAGPDRDGPDAPGTGSDQPRPGAGVHRATDPKAQNVAPADDVEQVLLDLALAGTASHVETIVRATRRARADPHRATALRALSWHHADDGSLILRGRFTPDDGAQLVAAIEALVAPRQPVTHPVPAAPEGWQDTGREQAPGAVDDRVAARRADALIALVGSGNSATGSTDTSGDSAVDNGRPVVARNNTHVIVHIEASSGAARIEGGPEIPPATAERIACDADVQVLLHDKKRNRLYLGRRRRLATPAQISALAVRDGAGCRFPGCSHIRHLRAHHVRHWFHQGSTDLDNLVLVCGFHHRLVHDVGYGIRWDGGRWLFTRPDGTTVPEAGAPLDGNTESLIELNTRAELRITRDGLTPYWEGERLEPGPILERLLPRPRKPAA